MASVFSCILCGVPIYDPEEPEDPRSWLREFRIIYSNPSGSLVSGIGCYSGDMDGVWTAPLDPTVQCDDKNISITTVEVPVMFQRPLNGSHGFLLHDACWHLLQNAFQLEEIPLKRLLEICESLPIPLRGTGVCWGHDYGGLLIFNDEDYYPWEDPLTENLYNKACSYDEENPYNVPEITGLLKLCSKHPQSTREPWITRKLFGTVQDDCFSKLPWEILEAIAIELPTNTALGLCCISKAFFPLISSNSFWASRFELNSDRSFLFEKRNSRDVTDWRRLYELTSQASSSLGLQNRRRIWNLIEPLTNIISLRLAEGSTLSYIDQESTCLRLGIVTGDIQDDVSDRYPAMFNKGCRLFGTHATQMPKDLLKISFSICSIGNITYVTGIRLTTEKGLDIYLGFVSKDKEVIYEAVALKGFILAIGSRGIHALKIVNKDTSLSEWIGCPNNSPITKRLASFDFIAELKVGFDGYKLVSLGVLGKFSPSLQVLNAQDSQLRRVALWYPKVPGPELFLNEESFIGENLLSTRYEPLFWIHFGGPSGCNLNYVTGVSVDYLRRLYGLEFHYSTTCGLAGASRLGRSKVTDVSEMWEFSIDGAGGELIETIEVGFEQREVRLSNFVKITTNRKRSFSVGTLSDNNILKPLAIAPGTTLTGLYASQHPEVGLISLGVISEAIDTRELSPS